MLTLLSPAKKLSTDNIPDINCTSTSFIEKTQELVSIMKGLSAEDIARLLHISADLAKLNYERYQSFPDGNFELSSTYPAIFLFHGDVYQNLCVRSWDKNTLAFSEDKLAILSGLYGLLRPLDAIAPYRLEMGTKLVTSLGGNLYDFWQKSLTKSINDRLISHENQVLINLASEEYARTITPHDLKFPIVTIHFKERKNGVLKIIGIFAKKARGAMAKYIMQNQLNNPEDIKQFTDLNYRFCEKSSTTDHYNFIRYHD